MAALRKIYKLANGSTGTSEGKKGGKQQANGSGAIAHDGVENGIAQRKEVEIAALGLMALKGS